MIPERRMNMKNDDKLREQLNSEPVPDRLKPENIKIMLDNEAPKKKRAGLAVSRFAAAAAACAVIGGTAAYNWNNPKLSTNKDDEILVEDTTKHDLRPSDNKTENDPVLKKQFSYMSGASDYSEVYTLFKNANEKAKKEQENREKLYKTEGAILAENALVDTEESAAAPAAQFSDSDSYGIGGGSDPSDNATPIIGKDASESSDEETSAEENTEPTTEEKSEPADENDPEYSETYYQEKDVLEADIVKTDGKRIYCVTNNNDDKFSSFTPVLHVASIKDGKFTDKTIVDLKADIFNNAEDSYASISEMYLYNDMIIIIGSDYSNVYTAYYENNNKTEPCGKTFVAFYTNTDQPELIDVYTQGGYYQDVRISPDGHILLITSFSSFSFDEVEDINDKHKYIPTYGMRDKVGFMQAEDILLPNGGFSDDYMLYYSVIGSVDISDPGAPNVSDIKSLAGYTGTIYCSADNLYSASYDWDEYYKTDITRISIKDGIIEPMAGTTIDGSIKDQFSMSEYNGYFRVAATYTETKKTYHRYDDDDALSERIWNFVTSSDDDGYYTHETIKTDTRVYVLDMDMNIVGSVGDLGVDEQLKSASFSGDMAYIVTFRQTDPLYAVDLSSPEKPVVLDEFKINGYSSYMQSWGEGLLLGFGQDADDDGTITGLRLTMFDNSDPNDLKALDVYTWNDNWGYDYENDTGSNEYYYSYALWDRKALLIAPEKNLIGIPITYNKTDFTKDYNPEQRRYDFFRFEDGKFVYIGNVAPEITQDTPYSYYDIHRALYVGDYVYIIAPDQFIAADINTLEVTDKTVF